MSEEEKAYIAALEEGGEAVAVAGSAEELSEEETREANRLLREISTDLRKAS